MTVRTDPNYTLPAEGFKLAPFWRVLPPEAPLPAEGIPIRFRAGAGWGSGAHETTRLCLQALGLLAPRERGSWRMLDFGSGSGILSIGAARLGASVEGVEIDEDAIASSVVNARLNGVSERIRFLRTLDEVSGGFDLVMANILRPVLLEFAPSLCARLAPGGTLILSGLVSTDLPEISVRYSSHLGGLQPEVYRRGEWCALIWRGHTGAISVVPPKQR